MLTSLTVVSTSPHAHPRSATFKSLSVRLGEGEVYKMWLGLPSLWSLSQVHQALTDSLVSQGCFALKQETTSESISLSS